MILDQRLQARHIAAKEILTRMNRVTDIWSVLDFYERYGHLPQERGPVRRRIDEMSRAELIRFCFTIQPTIAKLKKRIAAEKDELKKTALKTELAIRMEELQELQAIRDEG